MGQLKREGYLVTELPVDRDGLLSMDEVSQVITEDTAIVSVMWANNETGILFPVEEIANVAKSRGAIFHTDAVQSVGKIPINVTESQIDMLSLSGHKKLFLPAVARKVTILPS